MLAAVLQTGSTKILFSESSGDQPAKEHRPVKLYKNMSKQAVIPVVDMESGAGGKDSPAENGNDDKHEDPERKKAREEDVKNEVGQKMGGKKTPRKKRRRAYKSCF